MAPLTSQTKPTVLPENPALHNGGAKNERTGESLYTIGTSDSEEQSVVNDEANARFHLAHITSDPHQIGEEQEQHIATLARNFSRMSGTHGVPPTDHPFNPEKDSAMDPTSEKFDAEQWAKHFLHVLSRDPERYPLRTAGVAYQNLGVYGFGSATEYQKDVLNVLMFGVNMARDMMGIKRQKVQILKDLDGLIQSGEMCVVLGRPGSGVSTLLKTIAGQTHGLYTDEGSEFNYQGISSKMMQDHFRGEVIYQAETDIHFPHLTVGQTLSFASLARTPHNRIPNTSRQQYADHMRDVTMALFGLSHTVNTKVGNDFIRGVSGGERKRVSIAEATLSQAPLQCWDNSTRGLDSATALQFVRTLRLATSLTGSTAVVAIYQASQDAYDIFDKVLVLYEGRQIYFGRTDHAKKYFTDMGYRCLDRQTTADFLTSLTNPAERIVEPGFEDRVPRTPNEFAAVWKYSDDRARLLREIHQFNAKFPLEGPQLDKFKTSRKAQQASWMSVKSPYTISLPMQVRLCITRGFQRLRAEMTFAAVTVAGNLLISLVLGSVFYNLDETTSSFYGRGTLLFFAILFNALSNALEILPLYVSRPIVEKHATYALYHPFAEAISSMICDLPTKVASTIAFNIPLYFMANLRRDGGAVFTYLLFAFTSTLTMSMMFRTIGQTSRTISQAMAPLALFIVALVTYTGFVLPIRSMQGWLRWLHYINPLAYAFESLMVNEFHNRNFPCAGFVPSGPSYANVGGQSKVCSTSGAAPGMDSVNGDTYINAVFQYYHAHLWRNFGILVAFMIVFAGVYLVAAEYLSFGVSKGEVLIFRREIGKKDVKGAVQDEESQTANVVGGNTSITDPDPEESRQTVAIQKQTAIFQWEDLCYDITIKGEHRRILNQVDGWVKPGTLTALMGASGAGKTTLLDVLASRVTVGVVTGHVMVNGHPRDHSFQRKTGYVQQQDLHLLTSTVREALQFSALLRQPRTTPRQEKLDYVEEVIRLLEMEKYANAVVGVPGEGLNVEQRKRLTIGVELAAKPDLLLFLDEPTSGLDSQTAWSICTLINKLADNGQAILCTIHQPSALLFQQFDRLLLLAKGGRTVYFGDIGEDSKTMIQYFEKHGAQPCRESHNPAEWMLKVIGAAPGVNTERDWVQVWRASSEFAEVTKSLDEMKERLSSAPAEKSQSSLLKSFASPFYFQLSMCTRRALQQYWRDPTYIYAKLGLCTVTSLFLGFSFFKENLSIQGLQNQMFSFFMLLIIQVFLAYQAMPNFIKQRELYEARERPAKTYSWPAFMAANILVEIPWSTVAAVILFCCMYYPIGMYKNAMRTHAVAERGGLMFFLYWTFMLFGSTFTNMVVACASTAEIGAIVAVILFAMSLIFCGVLVGVGSLPGFWIFMYRVSPFTYLIGAFLSTGLANNLVHCSPLEILTIDPPPRETCGEYLADFMQAAGGVLSNPTATQKCQYCPLADTNAYLASVNSFYDQRWRNLGFMWVYVVFNVCAAVFLYWLVRVPKSWSWTRLLARFLPKVIEEVH